MIDDDTEKPAKAIVRRLAKSMRNTSSVKELARAAVEKVMREVRQRTAFEKLDRSDRRMFGNAMPVVALEAIKIAHSNPLPLGPNGQVRELDLDEALGAARKLEDPRAALNTAVAAVRSRPRTLASR
jgi:predicted ATP-dependent protease